MKGSNLNQSRSQPGADSSVAGDVAAFSQRTSVQAGTVLVADDEMIARELCCHHLLSEGFNVVKAADGLEALELLTDAVDVVLLDLRMPRLGGTECLTRIREAYPGLRVIVVSGVTDIGDAIEAIQKGADDFIQKPYDPIELINRVTQAVRASQLQKENLELRRLVEANSATNSFVATCQRSREVLQRAQRIAEFDSTVLITGASGTGKTKIARLIHERSERRGQPFVALNCASLPRELLESELFGHAKGAFTGAISDRIGKIESADGGTLFLDEIGDLPIDLQPKLLTFLQDRCFQSVGSNENKQVNVRVIAATHQNLGAMCVEKTFREDLLFRLNVLALDVPSLAERIEDLPVLANRILLRIAEQQKVEPKSLDLQALTRLKSHAWTGNVRELENVLERAAAFSAGNVIGYADLELQSQLATSSDEHHQTSLAGKTLAEIEYLAILQTLDATDGNKAMAARILGISEKSIYNKLKRHRCQLTNSDVTGPA